jgi:hypothetical protein
MTDPHGFGTRHHVWASTGEHLAIGASGGSFMEDEGQFNLLNGDRFACRAIVSFFPQRQRLRTQAPMHPPAFCCKKRAPDFSRERVSLFDGDILRTIAVEVVERARTITSRQTQMR